MRITKRINLIFYALLLFTLVQDMSAQGFDKLFDLYDQNNIVELQERVTKLTASYPQNNVLRFFSTLFVENGEQALQEYLSLFDKSEGKLKGYVADRLADYYYARGYYVTSQRYAEQAKKMMLLGLKTEAKSTKPIPEKVETAGQVYKIQVGAFGFRYNADQLTSMLDTQNIASEIVKRKVNGVELYCVWINGYASHEETKKYAENLKRKYHLHYRIIEK